MTCPDPLFSAGADASADAEVSPDGDEEVFVELLHDASKDKQQVNVSAIAKIIFAFFIFMAIPFYSLRHNRPYKGLKMRI